MRNRVEGAAQPAMTGPADISGLISGRRLTANSLFLLVGYATGRGAAFLLTVFLARQLRIEDLAIVVLAQTIALYVSMLLDFGITLAAIRFVATNIEPIQRVVSAVLIVRIGLAVVMLIAIGIAASWTGAAPQTTLVIAAFAVGAVIAACDISWAAQGLGRTGPRGVVIAVIALTQLGTTLLLLHLGLGIDAPAVGALFGAGAGVLIGLVLTLPSVGRLSKPTRGLIGATMRAALPLGLASFFTQIYYSFDILLLGASRPAPEVAVYGALYKLPSIFTTISWAVCIASLPGFAVAFHHGTETLRAVVERNVRVLLSLVTPILVLVAVEAPTVLATIFGSAFVVGVGALRILMASVELALVSGAELYGLAASGRPRTFTLAAGSGAALNVAFDLLTVPSLGMDAAAWGTVLAEGGVLAVACLIGRDIASRTMLVYAAGVAIAALLSFLVASTVEPASPLLAAVVALGLYGGLAACLRVWDPIHGILGRRFREVFGGRERIDGS